MKKGFLMVVSGPSGVGKGTICDILLRENYFFVNGYRHPFLENAFTTYYEYRENMIITAVRVYSVNKSSSFHVVSFIKTENNLSLFPIF